MADVLSSHRDRRHRVENLNKVEAEINKMRMNWKEEEEDVNLWRWKS